MGSRRTPRGAMIVAGLLLLPLLGLSPPASASAAADAYKYWGYYHATSSTWEYSLKGADQYVPKDGSVEGWRYGFQAIDGNRPPRVVADFDAICADAASTAGEKAVAVVIDYGIADEASNGDVPPEPRGECVETASDANGLEVLQAVAELRVNDFLVAIDGYPTKASNKASDVTIPSSEPTVELALTDPADETAVDESALTTETSDDDGFPWPIVAIGAVVVLIGAAALAMARRRA